MTSVDKLLIQGIRSFSPQNRNIIEFYKPLTIIVGQNGAGKTTIIECLKFSCTGEMPPNSRNGQAFIHDPKVAGEREVKAQVKMRFRSSNGKPIVVTRSLQLTQKAAKQELKSLESALQTYNQNNEKVSQSYRCADLDKEIPELMGVSKPIIENVIFCHQEDSNWPLAESSVLKKKFDDIFASTKYTKALEAIKKERKEQASLIKELKLRLENIQTHKEHSEKLKQDIASAQRSIEKANEEIKILTEKITQKHQRYTQVKERKSGAQGAIIVLKELKAAREQMVLRSKALHDDMQTEYTESVEELIALEKKFDREMDNHSQQERDLSQKISILEKRKAESEKAFLSLSEEYGKLQSNLERQKELIEERDRQIVSFTKRYKIPGYEGTSFTSEQSKKLLKKTEQMMTQLKDRIAQVKSDYQSQVDSFGEELDKTKAEHLSISTRLAHTNRIMEENRRKLESLAAEMKQKEMYQRKLGNYEQQIELEQTKLQSLKSSFDIDSINKKIEDVKQRKVDVEHLMAEASSAMRILNSQASLRATLSLKKAEKKKKEEALQQLVSSNQKEIESLLDGEPLPSPIEWPVKVSQIVSHKKSQLQEKTHQWQTCQSQVSLLQGQLQSTESQLDQMKVEVKEKEEALRPIKKKSRELPELIKEAEEEIEKKNKDIIMTQSAQIMYDNFISMTHENDECPLCERGIHGGEKDSFVERLRDVLEKVPSSLESSQKKLAELQQMLTLLRALEPDYATLQRLTSKDIPLVQKKIEQLTQQSQEAQRQASQIEKQVRRLEEEESEARKLLSAANSVARSAKELQIISQEVTAEETKLQKTSSDTRTVDEVSAEYENYRKESGALNDQLDKLRKDSQTGQQNVHSAETNLHKLKEEVFNMKGMGDQIRRIREESSKLEEENATLKQDVIANQQKVQEKAKQMEEILAKRNQIQKEASQREEEVQQEKNNFQSRLSSLKTLEQQLDQILSGNLQRQVEALQLSKKETEETLAAHNQELKATMEQIEDLREQLGQREMTKRNIADNIKYRKQTLAIREIDEKIKEKEHEVSAVMDLDLVDEDQDKLEKEYESLRSKRDKMSGVKATHSEQSKSLEKELSKQVYRTVDNEYRSMVIQLKTTEMASNDLEKYYKALDKALMKYHSVKMAEINKIIRELWQSTYRGNDIDTLEIRCDTENTTARSRSYNYRLVMIKGETDLDMRGRCSAGQKVLASLVIRLALAETFCINCGILALDEPTTNLDRHNVESFANALVNIIETRSRQSNFQLIIITHDEEFVQLIGKSKHADYYWRVSKDQAAHSIIERQDIADLS